MQSIYSIETYANGLNKDLIGKKEDIKCNNKNNNKKRINFDDV